MTREDDLHHPSCMGGEVLSRWPCLLDPLTSIILDVKDPSALFDKTRARRSRCHGLSDLFFLAPQTHQVLSITAFHIFPELFLRIFLQSRAQKFAFLTKRRRNSGLGKIFFFPRILGRSQVSARFQPRSAYICTFALHSSVVLSLFGGILFP